MYLRARWYDAQNGRFNRLDPFFGNLDDPQSLHKYAYVHGDPINGIDPTGKFNLVESVVSIGIHATANAIGFGAVSFAFDYIGRGLSAKEAFDNSLVAASFGVALAVPGLNLITTGYLLYQLYNRISSGEMQFIDWLELYVFLRVGKITRVKANRLTGGALPRVRAELGKVGENSSLLAYNMPAAEIGKVLLRFRERFIARRPASSGTPQTGPSWSMVFAETATGEWVARTTGKTIEADGRIPRDRSARNGTHTALKALMQLNVSEGTKIWGLGFEYLGFNRVRAFWESGINAENPGGLRSVPESVRVKVREALRKSGLEVDES